MVQPNPYAERVIGSIRRECLDHLIIIGEDHLRRILRDYFGYYHNSRPHQPLERNSPTPREIEAPVKGKVIAIPQVGAASSENGLFIVEMEFSVRTAIRPRLNVELPQNFSDILLPFFATSI